ncbi:MAG TPA: TIGR03364 family FAD-dependent oxidoreductase [Chitinophaga sp.]
MPQTAIVVGAGILGLATARALAVRGYQVTVFERHAMATGASIRNFGMVWPVGQPQGALYERAIFSRHTWQQVAAEANIWTDPVGSLHLAYHADEWQVMEEFAAAAGSYRNVALLTPAATLAKSPAARPDGLLGALWSSEELIVESRQAVGQVAAWLREKYGVAFHWNTAISRIEYPAVYSGKRTWSADQLYVCSGADFETLYPETFLEIPITKCKLQMLRLRAQPGHWRIGPALCGGLSLTHYTAFQVAPSLAALKARYAAQYPEYVKWGIHVMASQNHSGELTIGDTHEYGLLQDPFDREALNELVMDYLATFTQFKDYTRLQSWNGTYAKMQNGATEFIHSPEPGVTILNAPSGAGMTLSFGLAEEVVTGKYKF